MHKVKKRLGISKESTNSQIFEQTRKVIEFAECVRKRFPEVDFAVVGLGKTGEFPAWISDLRLTKLNDNDEREWCGRYAASCVVVGVYGSNMLLPSILAGSVIDLVGDEWWENYLQDVLFRYADAREMVFHYRFVPHSSTPEHLARLAATLLRENDFQRSMGKEFSVHREKYDLSKFLSPQSKKN